MTPCCGDWSSKAVRTPEDTAKAVTYYQQALALDPNFGRAWASLAWLYWNTPATRSRKRRLGITWAEMRRTDWRRPCGRPKSTPRRPTIRSCPTCSFGSRGLTRRSSLLEKAIALDSSDAWNYEAMSCGVDVQRTRPRKGAATSTRRCGSTRAWNGWRHYLAGLAYFSMDRFDEAVASLEKIDPKSESAVLVQLLWPDAGDIGLRSPRADRRDRRPQRAPRSHVEGIRQRRIHGSARADLLRVQELRRHGAAARRAAEGGSSGTGVRASIRNRRTGSPARRSGSSLSATSSKDACSTTANPIRGRRTADGFAHITIGLDTIDAPNTIEGDTICLNQRPDRGATKLLGDIPQPGRHPGAEERVPAVQPVAPLRVLRREGAGEESAAQAYRSAAEVPHGGTLLHDEAIANLERAIEIEPKNSGDLWSVAKWLILAGRVPDAQARIDSAIGLDPGSEAANCVIAGLLRFEEERFDEAAATLEKCAADHPYDSDARLLLVATYGHLGRAAEAAPHYAKVRAGEPWTIMWAGQRFPFKMPDDARRFREGLRKAGVAELPEPYDPASGDRLSGDEIRSLVLGHTLNYRNIGEEPGVKASTAFSNDGVAALSRPGRCAVRHLRQGMGFRRGRQGHLHFMGKLRPRMRRGLSQSGRHGGRRERIPLDQRRQSVVVLDRQVTASPRRSMRSRRARPVIPCRPARAWRCRSSSSAAWPA